MPTHLINRDNMEQQATQNFVEAGVLYASEAQAFIEGLGQYDDNAILTILLGSHQLHEQVADRTSCRQYYPLDMRYISNN